MNNKISSLPVPTSSRVFLLSQRNLKRQISRCVPYEFEDVICKIDEVELFAPELDQSSNNGAKIYRRVMRRMKNGRLQTPKLIHLEKEYTVFFALCQRPYELLLVNSVDGWKDKSQMKVCWIQELWASEIEKLPDRILNILCEFDLIITSSYGSIKQLQKETGLPCHYIPHGIDALRFSPYPDSPRRIIEFLSIGRRSAPLHQHLLDLSEKHRVFYFYDTLNGPKTTDHDEHRRLLANIAKRSNYFLVNEAKFNVPEQIRGQSEIAYRYFEGAAAGMIMIGQKPHNDVFDKYFHWCDAVIETPASLDEFEGFWLSLTHSSDSIEKIRRNNVYYSLMEHDWVYRWKEVLNLLNLSPTQTLIDREEALQHNANSIFSNVMAPDIAG